ncbi:MAG: TonB-dependent receptor [Cyclobacteriaceae bacterium]|nr:TonB-dependent receptor [Cyclobacteriaceae bacterium]
MRFIFSVIVVALINGAALGQKISGVVLDKNNREPIIGATILSLPDSFFTTSNEKGRFSLERGTSIYVSHISYSPILLEVNDNYIVVPLESKANVLEEIVVSTGGISEELINYGGSIGIIQKSTIERFNSVHPLEALNTVSGVEMQAGSINTNRITIRGVGARSTFTTAKIRAYYEDIPLTSGVGETELEDVDLQLVERIDIIKGPVSSLYGVGLGGVIKMYSKKAEQGSALNITNETGSFGLQKNTVRYQFGDNKVNFHLGLSNLDSEGYRANNEIKRRSGTFLADVIIDEKTEMSLLSNFLYQKAYIPSALNYDDYINNPTKAAFTWNKAKGFEEYRKGMLGVSIRRKVSEEIVSKSSVFTMTRNALEPRPFNILNENTTAWGARTSMASLESDKKIRFNTGVEFFNDFYSWSTQENLLDSLGYSAPGSLLANYFEKRFYVNFFGQILTKFNEKLVLETGFNLNKTGYDLRDDLLDDGNDQSGNYSFSPIVSPRATLRFYTRKNFTSFISVSHGFSPPTLEETLTPEGDLNPEIIPETGWGYELGVKRKLGRLLFAELSLYSLNIDNMLVTRRIAVDQFIGKNAGSARHNGIEFNSYLNTSLGEASTLNLVYNWTYKSYHFLDYVDDADDFSGNAIPGVSDHFMTFMADYNHDFGWYSNLTFGYYGKMYLNDFNSEWLEPYSLVHLKAGIKKNLGNHFYFNISGQIRNVFDTKYSSMIAVNMAGFGGSPRYYYPGLPRNYLLSTSIGIKL